MRTVTSEISTLVGKVGKAWKAAHLMECCSTMPSSTQYWGDRLGADGR